MDVKTISLYVMALLYVAAGVNHFYNTKMYMRIMPQYIPYHKPIVFVSGVVEILLGILLLIPLTSSFAAWGIIATLLIVFPANIHHLTSSKKAKGMIKVMLIIRLPLQAVLVYWAYWYTHI
jgi:uncharacterized membrane protein